MNKQNVALYIRVSTEDQAKEGYSLEVQREYLESFVKREGFEIFKLYSDEGISAYSTRRPALQNLLVDAKAKRFELVLVYKNEGFRTEEEELQKRVALQELREIERERSKDYLDRVEEFISGYSHEQKELSLDQEKQLAGLLFKNIKIARKEIFSFDFFAPFNSFFFEAQNSQNHIKNKELTKKLCLKSILRHLAVK